MTGNSHASTSAFLSTPSARRATGNGGIFRTLHNISIHALREEGDRQFVECGPGDFCISIHALREEGDNIPSSLIVLSPIFLSTPSARRAT